MLHCKLSPQIIRVSRFILQLFVLTVLVACTHPIDIQGNGDIASSTGTRDCSFEQAPCDYVITGAYNEIYTATARDGYYFSHWENCFNEQGNRCTWNIAPKHVKDNWGKTMPAMKAFFAPDNSGALGLNFVSAPFSVPNSVKFAKDVVYGAHSRNTFDIFLPNSDTPTALIIYIHGGGFTSGDKSIAYSERQSEIRKYLSRGIAYASINYRYLESNPEGLLASLNDAKRALQFMRFHSTSLNINESKIAVYGDSAGAGTSLWLALKDDGADPQNSDPILRKSTRVVGAAASGVQASYDFVAWETNVFSTQGITVQQMAAADSGLHRNILEGTNINSLSDIYSSAAQQLRQQLDMLAFVSADDPEVFLYSGQSWTGVARTKSELVHHALHALAVKNKADQIGLPIVSYMPALGVSHASGETHDDYLIRKVL